jgi:cobalt-zinc-cadmium efflux system membrane fusion protein
MSARLRRLVALLAGQVPTLLVLAGLAAGALWAHHHNWKFGGETARKPAAETTSASGLAPVTLAEETAAKVGIEVTEAGYRPLDRVVTANAVLAYDQSRYAYVSTPIQGTVWRVYRQVGERVEKGEVLALVSAPEVSKVKADLLQARVQVEIRQRTLQRLQAAASSLPDQRLRDAQMLVREARARLVADQQTLASYGLPVRLENLSRLSDEQVAERLRLLGLPADVVRGPESADLPASLLPLRAPLAGLVVRRHLVTGEVVSPTATQMAPADVVASGGPQFVLAETSRLWVMLDVRLEDAARLALGQEVTFRSDATGQTASGTLTWISADVDPKTRTVRARAEVPNPSGQLRPATFGTAQVLVASKPALAVPDRAVQWDGTSHRVFVRSDVKTYAPRLVLPGVRAAGYTELLEVRALQAVGAAGLLASPGGHGALLAASALPSQRGVLAGVAPGEAVVTVGSHALKSEMVKERIGGEE